MLKLQTGTQLAVICNCVLCLHQSLRIQDPIAMYMHAGTKRLRFDVVIPNKCYHLLRASSLPGSTEIYIVADPVY